MKKLFSIIASALLLVSCADRSKDVDAPFQAGQKVTLCASIASGDDASHAPQRVSGKDSNPVSNTGVVDLTWDAGDKVLVKVGDNSSVFTLTSGAGTNEGSFYGEMPGDGSSYDVVYPADYSEDVLTEQTYVENGFGRGLMKMSTNTRGTVAGGFTLSADNALVGLQLMGDGAKVSKIEFTNRANSNTYALLCPEIELTDESVLFYIVVPSGEWTQGFTITVYDGSGEPIKDFTKKSSSTFAAGKAIVMPVQPVYQKISVFSVSATQKVTFSPGNLQYHPKNDKWRFALNQLHVVGKDNKNISAEYDGWIDMFGWSGSTGSAKFGVSSAIYETDYSGDFVDWGTNRIGEHAPNTWRTLTNDEWLYLARRRTNADKLNGFANINGINGMILLPDEWECPAGITFKSGFTNLTYSSEMDYGEHQSISANQWAMMEQAGALFLPAYGYRNGTEVVEEVGDGYYSSATIGAYNQPRFFHFNSIKAVTQRDSRIYGLFVRLVKDL